VWVSICAAAPEFLWQGLRLFIQHLALDDVIAALLIGTILAFFIEPLVERLRTLRWRPTHEEQPPTFVSLPLSIAFGAVAVCIHDAVSTYVNNSTDRAALARALTQLPEWALVPFAVTLAWFSAGARASVCATAALLACAVIVAVGIQYQWGLQDIVTTVIPAWALVAGGVVLLRRAWEPRSIDRLAVMTALTALSWFLLVGLAELVLFAAGSRHWHLYDYDEFLIDVRYYIGWSLGIVLAPNPLRGRPERA
jgi:hypothetical protein